MQRRKFLVGMGSLAAGSAAVVGTGAVDTVQAERPVTVDVKGDAAAAYLGLDANDDSTFVANASPLTIDFAQDTGNGGSGVNNDATTEVRPAFTMTNQFGDTLFVEADNPGANSDLSSGGVDVQFVAVKDPDGFVGTSSNPAVLFDRQTPVKNVDPMGSNVDPASITQKPGGPIERGLLGSRRGPPPTYDPRYIELGPGESIDVITRVVANDATESDLVVDRSVEIEAFEDESNTTLSTVYDPH